MQKCKTWLVALTVALLLSGCAEASGSAVPLPASESEPQSQSSQGSSETNAPESPDALLYAHYVDDESLPAPDFTPDARYTFEDRTIVLEDSVENALEGLAYAYYYNCCAADFDALVGLVGENEALQNATKSEGVHYREGRYMTEYTIHEISTLTADDLQRISPFSKQDLARKIDNFTLKNLAVVRIDVSWKHNEASLQAGPQLGDGRYERYYLFATTQTQPAFKLYEVYWEDFLEA